MPQLNDFIDIILTNSLRFLALVCRHLPKGLALLLLETKINSLFIIVPRFKKTTLKNLSIAFPDLSHNQKIALYRKSKKRLALNFYYFTKSPQLTKEKSKELCDFTEINKILKKARDSKPGRGLLVLTMHFDCYEYFLQVYAFNDKQGAVLNRLSGMKRLDTWWNSQREMYGHEMFNRKGGYREIIRRIKNGQDILVLCDQNVKNDHAVFVNFFGKKAATTKTIALAALQTGAKVLVSFQYMQDDGTFFAEFKELTHPSEIEGSKEDKIFKFTKSINSAFEDYIKKKPESWYWMHRRWKTRPEGDAEDIY